jgi:hypothetical protein
MGPNVLIVDPGMPDAQRRIDSWFAQQESAHFTDRRYAVLLKPGAHRLDINVGFFTQVTGLGLKPDEVTVMGHVHAEADWAKGMALVNFWRSVENMAVRPPDGADRWAVSQAAPYRRIHLAGDLALDDGGWSSGGFMADCHVEGTVRSGTQQQWFTRNAQIGGWQGSNWNMMFSGVTGAPQTSFPEPPYTTLPSVPVIREKPFLHIGPDGGWAVFIPALRRDVAGVSWQGQPMGRSVPLSTCLIAHPTTPVETINRALTQGRHLILTPGVYRLREPIRVVRPDTVVLGLGLATLLSEAGNAAMTIADVPGVSVAGLLIDAGPQLSRVLVEVGPKGSARDHRDNPTLLADVFFRVGGAAVGNVGTCLEINSRHVIADHLWIWRADHGDHDSGRVHIGWNESRGEHGLVVNGDDVTCYGLFVEHFQGWQTLWNGENGRTFFYQNELPYDPPSQKRGARIRIVAGRLTRLPITSATMKRSAWASMPTSPPIHPSCWPARWRCPMRPMCASAMSRRFRSAGARDDRPSGERGGFSRRPRQHPADLAPLSRAAIARGASLKAPSLIMDHDRKGLI